MKAEFWDRKRCAAWAASKWWNQYYHNIRTKGFNWDRNLEIYDGLVSLGPDPNPDDVDRIIGNSSWSWPGSCGGCGTTCDKVVVVGEKPDYDSHTARLCKDCVLEALHAFEED